MRLTNIPGVVARFCDHLKASLAVCVGYSVSRNRKSVQSMGLKANANLNKQGIARTTRLGAKRCVRFCTEQGT